INAVRNLKQQCLKNQKLSKYGNNVRFKKGDIVFCKVNFQRKKLDAIYEGPYKIIAVISDVSFVVQDLRDANIYKRVHSMNMKLNETNSIPGNEVFGCERGAGDERPGQELYTVITIQAVSEATVDYQWASQTKDRDKIVNCSRSITRTVIYELSTSGFFEIVISSTEWERCEDSQGLNNIELTNESVMSSGQGTCEDRQGLNHIELTNNPPCPVVLDRGAVRIDRG
ncbi:hypothetical protein J6590_079607, partial [Homalodisca vitripennis]